MENFPITEHKIYTRKLIFFFLLLHIGLFYFFHFNHSAFEINYAGDNYANIFDSFNYEKYTQDDSYIDSFSKEINTTQFFNDHTFVFKLSLIKIVELMPFATTVFLQFLIMFLIYVTFIINILKFNLKNKYLILILLLSLTPSFNYWSCYISKTSIIALAVNLVFLFILTIYLQKKITLFSIAALLSGLFILFFIKQTYIYLFMYLFLNLLIFFIFKNIKIILFFILFFINILFILFVFYIYDIYNFICNSEIFLNSICSTKAFSLISYSQDLTVISNSYSDGSSTRDIKLIDIKELVLFYPYYFYLSFFGPGIFEINNIFLLILYMEKIFIFVLIIFFLKDNLKFKKEYILTLFVLVIIFFIFTLPYTTQSIWNIGSGIRYRTEIFLPFIYFLILYKNKIITY